MAGRTSILVSACLRPSCDFWVAKPKVKARQGGEEGSVFVKAWQPPPWESNAGH